MIRNACTIAVLAVYASIVAACVYPGAGGPPRPQPYPDVVETATAEGLDVYWLGESFEAGGLTFDVIEATYPQGVRGVPVDGLDFTYLAFEGDDSRAHVDLSTFSKEDWSRVNGKVRDPVCGPVVT